MNPWLKVSVVVAAAVSTSVVNAGTAVAYETIDYGTNEAACRAAEKQAKSAGYRYADCFQTGPGHYSLALDD